MNTPCKGAGNVAGGNALHQTVQGNAPGKTNHPQITATLKGSHPGHAPCKGAGNVAGGDALHQTVQGNAPGKTNHPQITATLKGSNARLRPDITFVIFYAMFA